MKRWSELEKLFSESVLPVAVHLMYDADEYSFVFTDKSGGIRVVHLRYGTLRKYNVTETQVKFVEYPDGTIVPAWPNEQT